MALLDLRGSGEFLFQVRPDVFPEGFLTQVEVCLWIEFYKEKEARNG